jgi:hypothetical protein
MDEDPMAAARGIVIGLMLSIPFWLVMFLWMRSS